MWPKIIVIFGLALNVIGAAVLDRVTVHGAQLTGYMNAQLYAEVQSANARREALRKLSWKIMLLGFVVQALGVLFD